MSWLVQILRAKAHWQQILQSDDLNIGLIQLLSAFILHCALNSLLCICHVPVAPYHEHTSLQAAVFSNDLSTDAAWTATALEVACYRYSNNVASLNLACCVLFLNVESMGSDESFGESGAFSTDSAAVGCVLVVGAEDDLAPFGEEGRANAELAIREEAG